MGQESTLPETLIREMDNRDELLISVIIPTHNRKEMVCQSIDSALAQTYPHMEIIVVDDGSTDGTYEHLLARYEGRIRIVRKETATGAGAARNFGASHSQGDMIAFLDSDDVWHPRKLEAQLDIMESCDESVALVGSSCEYMDKYGNPTSQPDFAPDSATYEDFCIRIRLPGSGSNHLIRRIAFDQIGGFDESLLRAQDKDLWIRLLEHHEVRYAREITAKIRIHDSPRINVNSEVIIECRRRIDEKIPRADLRRKASAWSNFSFFRVLWPTHPIRALSYLIKSFLLFPTRLDSDTERLKPALRILLKGGKRN